MATPGMEFPDLKDMDDLNKVRELAKNRIYSCERKFDGTACMADFFPKKEGKAPILWGRGVLKDGNQQVYNINFPEMVEYFTPVEAGKSGMTRILGELVCFNGQEIEKFKWIQPRLTRKYGIEALAKEFPATFMAFDILVYNGTSLENETYAFRRRILEEVVDSYFIRGERFQVIPTYYEESHKDALIRRLLLDKFEGVVLKDRTKAFKAYKYKPTITEDVIWCGEYNEGTGKNRGKVGSLVTYQYVEGHMVEIANVGGLTDELRDWFTAKAQEVTKENPLVLEVEAMSRGETTKKGNIGKLRHPRYSRIRTDKSPKQCTRDE
jgi:ATP-dependent DNA ligase